MTGEAAAAATAVNAEAAANEALANAEAAESQTLAATGAGAYTTLVSTLAAAATSATNDLADAGLTLAQSMNGAITGFLNAATSAGKALADTSVTEGVALANSIAGLVNGFTHSYIGATVAYNQDVVEEGRTADKDADSAVTGLASGIGSAAHNVSVDSLDEDKVAALAYAAIDDVVTIAQSVLNSASGVLSAAITLAEYVASPLSSFSTMTPSGGGSGVMAGVAAAPVAPAEEGGFWSSIGSSVTSIGTSFQAMWYDVTGDTVEARRLYAEAYANGPIGQSSGGYRTGVYVALGVATTATAAAVGVGTVTHAFSASGTQVFWSGVSEAQAAHIATQAGGATLEMTFGGRVLTAMSSRLPASVTMPLWRMGSRIFASGATGEAIIVQPLSGAVRTASTWATIEYPILMGNHVSLIWTLL
jgi:hypothetical protein